MKKHIIYISLMFFLSILLVSCMTKKQENKMDAKKYDYGIKVTSADGYRCMISWVGCYLGSFHAQKADDVNYSRAFPTRTWNQEEAFVEYSKNLYPFIHKEMEQKRISSAYWESLNTPYRWKLSFNDDRFSLYNYRVYTINQENREYMTDPDWPVKEGDKFIPAELTLYLKYELDPIKYKVVIELRKQYITYSKKEDKEKTVLNHMNRSRTLLRFFDSFYREASDKDVSIYLDFDDSMKQMKLKLKAGDLEEEFPGYTYKIYDSEKYNIR